MRYFAARLMQTLFLLVGVSFLTFLFSAMAPGNYLDEMRLNPQISPATLASLRAQYQLDQPLPVRYARWLMSLAHGELGYSFAYNTPVAPLLWACARNTLLLSLQSSLGLTYLFITHDLRMAVHLADEIAVMQDGRIVELGASERVFHSPAHEITRQLLKAHTAPDLTPGPS